MREAKTLDDFRNRWIKPTHRWVLINALETGGYSPTVIRIVEKKENYDLYDVLAELGWGLNPRTRPDRARTFRAKHEDWINGLPQTTAATIQAIADQFQRGGTDGLENRQIFRTPSVQIAGGTGGAKTSG